MPWEGVLGEGSDEIGGRLYGLDACRFGRFGGSRCCGVARGQGGSEINRRRHVPSFANDKLGVPSSTASSGHGRSAVGEGKAGSLVEVASHSCSGRRPQWSEVTWDGPGTGGNRCLLQALREKGCFVQSLGEKKKAWLSA